MNRIAVIGTGQLGSRHLQALANLKIPADIIAVDPSEDSLAMASARWKEMHGNDKKIELLSSIDQLPVNIDLVIVATGSAMRRQVVEKISSHCRVRYMILEKFLFQSESDFYDVEEILQSKSITTWVNCPRRIYPGYQQLKDQLSGPMIMNVTGSTWGLACNSIHWLDTFSWLTGEQPIEIVPLLDKGFIPAKRTEYVEFNGSMIVLGEKGSKLFIHCFNSGNHPLLVTMSSPAGACLIFEQAQKKISLPPGDAGMDETEFKILRQSEMTNLIVDDILNAGNCDLPSYKHSMRLHLHLLKIFLRHYNLFLNTPENSACPVT